MNVLTLFVRKWAHLLPVIFEGLCYLCSVKNQIDHG
jgi:hypothetical protein